MNGNVKRRTKKGKQSFNCFLCFVCVSGNQVGKDVVKPQEQVKRDAHARSYITPMHLDETFVDERKIFYSSEVSLLTLYN